LSAARLVRVAGEPRGFFGDCNMVGGTVIEVCNAEHRSDALYVDTIDKPAGRKHGDTCAIYVERTAESERIEIGDALWWQGAWAYWTPKDNRRVDGGGKAGVDYDIKISRIGYSGVTLPSRRKAENA
jgi:hypothetical protein